MNWAATEDDIILLFSQFGPVDQVRLVFHADGVRRRNIVFIELLGNQNAEAALIGLNGKEFMGLRLSVQQAWSREEWLRRKLEFGK